jgi:hypothetical protein
MKIGTERMTEENWEENEARIIRKKKN